MGFVSGARRFLDGFESESRDLKEQPGLETIMNVMSRCDPIKNPKITIKNRDPIKNP